MRASPVLDVWRVRAFRRYAVAQGLSICGNYVGYAGLAWYVLDAGLGAGAVGLISAARYAPALLNPLAGRLADRFDRRRLIAIGEVFAAISGVLMTVVALHPGALLPLACVCAAMMGFGSVMAAPSHDTTPATLAGEEALTRVTGAMSAVNQAARLMAPLVVFAVIALMGNAGCFAFNALTSALVAAVALTLPARRVAAVAEAGRTSIVGLIRRTPAFGALLLPYVAWCVFGPQTTLLTPLLAMELGGESGTAGVLQSSLAVGALATSALVMSRVKANMSWYFAGLLFSGLASLLAAVTWNVPSAIALMVVLGAANCLAQVMYSALVLHLVPDEDRGKAMSIGLMILFGGVMAGSLIFGEVTERYGVATAFVVSGVVTVAVALPGLLRQPWGASSTVTDASPSSSTRLVIVPASFRSASAERSKVTVAASAPMTALDTSARCETLASDLARRTSARAVAAATSTSSV